MKCIGNINKEVDTTSPTFNTAIDAWDYIESKGFEGNIMMGNMSFKERAKFARWCMGNRCVKNTQEYVPE